METIEVKKKLTKKRIDIQEIKSDAGKLGEETTAIMPQNLEAMFAGKMCNMLIKTRVASENIMWAYCEKYLGIPNKLITKFREAQNPMKKIREYLEKEGNLETFENLVDLQKEYSLSFERFKRKVSKIVEEHPLYKKFKAVRGFTPYQMALVMAHIKEIKRFETPSRLMIYSGIGCVQGMPVTKANLNKIKEIYLKQGKEFKGFNTALSGRMFVINDCLLRAKGFFYEMYGRIRKRLEEGAINKGMVEKRDVSKSKKKKEYKYYMKGKKNQSLILWSDRGAKRRIGRTLLYLIWKEWREMEGLPTRLPYPIEYMGHSDLITLEEVVAFDSKK